MSRVEREKILDDKEAILALDKSGLLKDELEFSHNLEKAVRNVKAFKLPSEVRVGSRRVRYSEISEVALVGMGGSAIAGDILKDWIGEKVHVPLETIRGYSLPAYIDENTLVFFISYSGNTEETLSCMAEAVERGCKMISICSDGALQRVTEALGLPLIRLPKMAAARASLPYLFAPLPYLLAQLGLLSVDKVDREMEDAIGVVSELARELSVDVSASANLAKKAALKIYGTVPVVYSYDPYRSVGLRFKTQVNENCKLPARFDVFPELNHNEVMGWEASEGILKHYAVILIREVEERPEVKARINVLKEKFFSRKARSVIEVRPRGKMILGRIFSLIFTLDMVSMYLAVLHRRDPVASETFQILKYEVTERLGTLRKLEEQIQKLALA